MPFQKGNKLANNNYKAIKLREDLIKKTIANSGKINDVLIEKALKGEMIAIKEIFDRTLGKSTEFVDITSGGEPIIYVDPIIAAKNKINVAPSPETNSN